MADDFQHFDQAIKTCTIIHDNIIIKNIPADQTIFTESETTAQVYFILAGKVKVTSYHSNGKEVWHAALTKGSTFGEMAAISGLPRSATIETLQDSKIGVLSQPLFSKALESAPGVALFFLREMVSRLQATTRYSNERIALELPGRISAELLRQSKETPSNTGMYEVHRDLTVTALAQQLNTSREAVSRTISAFIDDKYVTKVGRQFFIIDKAALIRRAEG